MKDKRKGSQLEVRCERVGYNAGMVAFASTQIETAKRAAVPRADARAGGSKAATVSFWSDGDEDNIVSSLSIHDLLGFYIQEQPGVASVDQRNQQYSVYCVTSSSAAITERYAYTAYGEPTICNSSGTVIGSSSISNRYTYTGREWDGTFDLYHFRARWMSGLTGRFLIRDLIGYFHYNNLFSIGMSLSRMDPSGHFEVVYPTDKLNPSEEKWLKGNCSCISDLPFDDRAKKGSLGLVHCDGNGNITIWTNPDPIKIDTDRTDNLGDKELLSRVLELFSACVGAHEKIHVLQLTAICPDVCKGKKNVCVAFENKDPTAIISCKSGAECWAHIRSYICIIDSLKAKEKDSPFSREEKEQIAYLLASEIFNLKEYGCTGFPGLPNPPPEIDSSPFLPIKNPKAEFPGPRLPSPRF